MMESTISKNRSTGMVTISVELSSEDFCWCWGNAWRLIKAGLALGFFGWVRVNFNHDNPRANRG